MALTGNLPKHLEVAARSGVLASPARDDLPYRQVAMEVDLSAASQTLVDLGGVPLPTENPKDVDTLIEKFQTIAPKDWSITIHVSQNAIDDDQTGSVERKFRNVMPAFQRHINNLVFTWLNAGDGSTYGLGPDGLSLFNDSHLWKGAKNTTAQDNSYAVAISLDNFNTVWVQAQSFLDDQSNYFNFNYNLLVTHPTNNVISANITGNTQAMDTANREINPYAGTLSYITTPYFDTTAWVLVAASEPTKPIIVGIRKRPQLVNMWFDSQADNGGIHYFQYNARYNLAYGDWPVAIMGNS
jgi:phage major head subunit gpT-like protein